MSNLNRYAFLDSNNIIQYVLMCDDSFAMNGYTSVLDTDENAGIGYLYSNNTFIAPLPDFSNYQQSLLTDLSSQITYQEGLGVMYQSNLFPTDTYAQIKYTPMLLYATMNSNFTTLFSTLNNGYINLNASDIVGICGNVTQYIQNVFTSAATIQANITNASNIEQLLTIDVTQGWPTSNL